MRRQKIHSNVFFVVFFLFVSFSVLKNGEMIGNFYFFGHTNRFAQARNVINHIRYTIIYATMSLIWMLIWVITIPFMVEFLGCVCAPHWLSGGNEDMRNIAPAPQTVNATHLMINWNNINGMECFHSTLPFDFVGWPTKCDRVNAENYDAISQPQKPAPEKCVCDYNRIFGGILIVTML